MGSRVNFAHLDHLSEEVTHAGQVLRFVHLYADAPGFRPAGDPVEGLACVDDAARAAVVYLRHFATTADSTSQTKAEQLLRFVMYMQHDDGAFHNFILDGELTINSTHPRSRGDDFHWWASRSLWALATGARVLSEVNPTFARQCFERACLTLPHLTAMLERYPQQATFHGRPVPQWLLQRHAADSTSEALLGLVMLQEVESNSIVATLIERFAEGIALMRYGSMNTFPYGSHASSQGLWHGWGNSQTQALAEAGYLDEARREADHFYPRLLVESWRHSMTLDAEESTRRFERIAYAVRCVAVGLVRIFEATQDDRYAVMAGLAASWLTGNNAAREPMYNPTTGRGYDGIDDEAVVNHNSGAESTIESLYTLVEVEQCPIALEWLDATGEPPVRTTRDQQELFYRVFRCGSGSSERVVTLLMNLTTERMQLLRGCAEEALDARSPFAGDGG